MPVSENEETAITSLGGQSSLNIAGVPMKKRKFIWPPSPTPEEQSSLLPENVAIEKESRTPSEESKLTASSSFSDANKNFVPEENKKGFDNIVSTNSSINTSRSRIEEPSLAIQSDSSVKSDDDEKSVVTENSANILTGGVPMKKRRFIRPSSPAGGNWPSPMVENDSFKKKHDSPPKEMVPSNASVAASSYGLSDENEFLPDKYNSNDMVQFNAVSHSRVKIEEPCPTVHSVSLDKLNNVEKLLKAEKSAIFFVKSAETELKLAAVKAPALNVRKEILNQRIAEGNCKGKSIYSVNHELSLGLVEHNLSALGDQSNNGSCWKQGNMGSFSLKLSLSNSERDAHCKVDDVQSNTNSANIFADRLNWDLNTTMDTWETSVSDEAAGQVVAGGSNTVGITNDVKPLAVKGLATNTMAAEKHLLNESDSRTSFTGTSSESGQSYNSVGSLHLRLSPSFAFSQEPSSSSASKDSCNAIPNISLSRGLLSGGLTVNSRTIKSEPFDDTTKNDTAENKAKRMAILGFKAVPVKSELVKKHAHESLKLPNSVAAKSVGGKSMKSELFHGDTLETLKMIDGTSHNSDKQVPQGQDTGGLSTCSTNECVTQGQDAREQSNCSMTESVLQGQVTGGQSNCLTDEQMLQGLITKGQDAGGQSNCLTNENVLLAQDAGGQSNSLADEQKLQGPDTSTRPTSSIGLSVNGNMLDHLYHDGIAEGTHLGNETSKESRESAEQVALELALPVRHSSDELNGSGAIGAPVTEEKTVENSDQAQQKIKDELPPDPQRVCEGTVSDEEKINLLGDMLEEDSYDSEYESDGYEDGEVREPQTNAAVEGPICEKREESSHRESDEKANSAEVHCDLHPTSSDVEEKDNIKEEPGETMKDNVEDIHGNTIDDAEKDTSGEEPSAVERSCSGADERKVVKKIRRKTPDLSANKHNYLGIGQPSDQFVSGDQGTLAVVTQETDENTKMNAVEKNDSALPKVETSVNADDVPKDANSGGNQSRIINLSIASNMSSFGKTRTLSGKPLSSHPGRERLPDAPLEGERLHPRGREDTYNDASHKFSRERYQDHSSRKSRWNIVHGRGRLASRIDSLRNDRDSERECVPRHKYTGLDSEFMNYNIGSDGDFVGSVRGGRKLLDDETPMFQMSSRRRSPGGREGPASRGLQMVRRVPRNMDDDNSEVIGLRHEKIMRGFPGDGEEHAYSRPQTPYEGLEGRFIHGTRNFSSVQRRGLPQMRSKSPIRSRSPGPWSSRRRSPDGFGGPPELPHCRSPIYRMERIRSPNNPGFTADRVPRRHGSPSYFTRPTELREMDPGRDHGHPRSIISNRSPSGRLLLRNSRRFGIVDPRDRAENDEFFGGPVHSGRFHELGGDGTGEDRQRFDERRPRVRSFMPPFNAGDSENFHLNTEDGPRSFRYFPEDNPEFHEQPREFDRRIKNRPGNGPRRPRSIEVQEGNYRHGGQVLYDDGFDDMSRVKRKRF